jgi:hypothetical protein
MSARNLGAMSVPTAPIVAGSLVGGYVVARTTRIRPLGGAVLAAGGLVAQRQWARKAGPVNAAILSGVYYGAFGVSHPLAKKIGAWPSVLTVAGVAAAAAWLLSDRKR